MCGIKATDIVRIIPLWKKIKLVKEEIILGSILADWYVYFFKRPTWGVFRSINLMTNGTLPILMQIYYLTL